MIRTIRLRRLLSFTATLLFLGQLPLWADATTSSAALPKTVATVNRSPIYETALTAEMQRIVAKGWTTGMSGNTQESIIKRRSKALDTLITNELLRQASRTQTLEDLDNKVNQRILEMKKKYPSEEIFTDYLKSKNRSIDIIRSEARDDIQLQEYINKIKNIGPLISDSEVEKFYNDSKKNFIVPEKIKVRHILVKIDGSTAAQVEKALKKATDLREKVFTHKNFASVAKESSACASATNGGELEYFARGVMPADFDKVAFSLKIGETSEPVKTNFGFHIIEVIDKKPEYTRPFSEVKEFVATYLKQRAGVEKINAHVIELKKTAKIEIAPD